MNAEPTTPGDVVRDRDGDTWARGSSGWWQEQGPDATGRLRWADLERTYGPLVPVRKPGGYGVDA